MLELSRKRMISNPLGICYRSAELQETGVPAPLARPNRWQTASELPLNALCAGADMVLVGEDDFVEVGGDSNLVVSEVGEPSAAAVDRVGQKGKDFAQGERHHGRGRVVRRRGSGRGFGFWTVIDLEAASCLSHSVILDEVMLRRTTDPNGR